MKKILFLIVSLLLTSSLVACSYETNTIIIAEGDWQSNQFYDQIAKVIIEEGFGVEVDIKLLDTTLAIQSLKDQGVDLSLEIWSDNIPSYDADIEAGLYEELTINFNDNFQGLYVPTYLAEAYDLVYVTDLLEVKSLFPDPDKANWNPDTDKAVVYGGPSGWSATAFLAQKFSNSEVYPELVEHFEFRPLESAALLAATITAAYEEEAPWLGYYWEPTAIMGVYDMTLLLDDKPFDAATGTGNFPTNDVTVVVRNGFKDDYPEIYDFLSNFNTSSQIASDALGYMTENDLTAEDAAKWWLKNNVSIWGDWVSEEIKDKVLNAID